MLQLALTLPTLTLGWLLAAALLAGLAQAVNRTALPLGLLVLSAFILPLPLAATVALLPTVGWSLWRLLTGPSASLVLLARVPLLLGIGLGALIGILPHLHASWPRAPLLLGSAVIVTALLEWPGLRLPIPPRFQRGWPVLLAGFLTGLLAVSIGLLTLPLAAWLRNTDADRPWQREAALEMGLVMSAAALAVSLAAHSGVPAQGVGLSMLLLIPAALGWWLGCRLTNQSWWGNRATSIGPAASRGYCIAIALLGMALLLRS